MNDPRIATIHGQNPSDVRVKQHAEGNTGQHSDYIILSDEERAKGFVVPVRNRYVHEKCGAETFMGRKLAETYASDPTFYGATFCCKCNAHFPVGESGQFVWSGTQIKVGTIA